MNSDVSRKRILEILKEYIVGGSDGDTDNTVWYATDSPEKITDHLIQESYRMDHSSGSNPQKWDLQLDSLEDLVTELLSSYSSVANPREISRHFIAVLDPFLQTTFSETIEARQYYGALRIGVALIADRSMATAATLSAPARYGYAEVGRQLRALLAEPMPTVATVTGSTDEVNALLQASSHVPPPGGAAMIQYATFQGAIGASTWQPRSTLAAAQHTAHVFGPDARVAKRVIVSYADGANFYTAWQTVNSINSRECTLCRDQFTID